MIAEVTAEFRRYKALGEKALSKATGGVGGQASHPAGIPEGAR